MTALDDLACLLRTIYLTAGDAMCRLQGIEPRMRHADWQDLHEPQREAWRRAALAHAGPLTIALARVAPTAPPRPH